MWRKLTAGAGLALARGSIDPCAANTTRLVCRFRHLTGLIAGCQAIGRAGIHRSLNHAMDTNRTRRRGGHLVDVGREDLQTVEYENRC